MSLKNIYTYGGFPARRNLTVADIIALKGVRKMTHYETPDEILRAALDKRQPLHQ